MFIFETFFVVSAFAALLIFASRENVTQSIFLLFVFNVIFLFFIFGSQVFSIVTSGPGVLVFTPLLVFDLHMLIIIFWGRKLWGVALSLIPIFISLIPSQAFIIPTHPLILLYQFNTVSDFLPRFPNPFLNTIIIYLLPVLIFNRRNIFRSASIFSLLIFFTINFSLKNYHDNMLKTVRVLVVQVGLFVEKGYDIDTILSDINRYSDIDLVVFSESTEFGAKRGARRIQTQNLIDQLKKQPDRAYVLSLYGYSDKGIDYNYRTSLFIDNERLSYYPKLRLVPGWETRGLFYQNEVFDADYLATPDSKIKKIHKLFNKIDIAIYSCFEAFFYPKINGRVNLNIIQSRYTDIKSNSQGEFNRSVVFGNILSYFMLSPDYTPLLSVQDSGGSVYIDSHGRFDSQYFIKSLNSPLLTIDIKVKL